jgi:hypothetical protein
VGRERADGMTDQVDPFAPDARATDNDAKRALHNEANELLDKNGVFMLAVRSLRIQWFNELMVAKDWETKDDLTRKMQVLTTLPQELQRFISDYKFALNKRAHAGRN